MIRNEHLIYDVGFHRGEDTDFYLKKGYQVIAFEANPILVELGRKRFEMQIRSGQLQIVAGAIAPPSSTGKVSFYVNERSAWGTIDTDWVNRNTGLGTESRKVEVDEVNIEEIFTKFGIPFYLKIDIEGADGLVLDALQYFPEKPMFVSVEVNSVNLTDLNMDLERIFNLGYKQFQLVPQKNIQGSVIQTKNLQGVGFDYIFPPHASGRFGDELSGFWMDRDAVTSVLKPPFGWQDLHATLRESSLTNVALKRPATQSSTSRWSVDPNPDVDACIANNGDVASNVFFHTSKEMNPWWQVDLGGMFTIEKVVIFNRLEHKARLRKFTLLGSHDGAEWFSIFQKSDEKIDAVFQANIQGRSVTRFVRLRLDGFDFLHFRECQIFGEPAHSLT